MSARCPDCLRPINAAERIDAPGGWHVLVKHADGCQGRPPLCATCSARAAKADARGGSGLYRLSERVRFNVAAGRYLPNHDATARRPTPPPARHRLEAAP